MRNMTKEEQEAIKAYLVAMLDQVTVGNVKKKTKRRYEIMFLASIVLTAECLGVKAPAYWQICILSGRSILETSNLN